MAFSSRLKIFFLYIFFSIITLGIYPIYYWVIKTDERNQMLELVLDRQRSNANVLKQIRDEIKEMKVIQSAKN